MWDEVRILKERVDLRIWLWSIGIALVGLVFVFYSTRLNEAEHHWTGALSQEGGAALFIAGVLSMLWERGGKRAFADEILAKANMARDLAEAGLVTMVDSFKDARIDWGSLFKNACRLDMFISWGATWRNTHAEQIEKLLSDEEARLRIVLPDPEDRHVVESLANRFQKDTEYVRRMIDEARGFFQHQKDKAEGKGKVEIYYTKIVPVFTFYRFNNKAVFALYNHRTDKQPVPTAVCDSEGFFYRFISAEFDGVLADERTRRIDQREVAPESPRITPAEA
jgi:hypothetical protein